jgi:DNA topoisomerase IB
MPRLRTVSTQQPGWTRVGHGRGFRYLDHSGRPLEPDDVARVKALVIPPAWTDVWISPYANGHLQAVGTDEAGRRQYLYHDEWRRQRDEAKFDRVIEMATLLPDVRRRLRADLAAELGRVTASSRTARSKAVREAVVSASELLGNTPTVCRSSYVDPRVIDLYESDVTIANALARMPEDVNQARDHLDRAVVDLLAA